MLFWAESLRGYGMEIIITGSIAYDYIMKFPGHFQDHILPDQLGKISLSFLVESMVRQRGGIAPNIAYTLALLGKRARIMATAGEDFEDYRQWLESVGVNTSAVRVIPGEFTATFFANTDLSNAQIASFYPGAMAYATQLSFHDLDGPRPDLAVISPNDPGAMQRYVEECKDLDIPYLFDPSQQIVRMDSASLRCGIQGALALFANDYEFNLIQKITGLTPDQIKKEVQFMVITRGHEGASLYKGKEEYHIPIVPCLCITDPTGIGDAFRGGFLAGFSRGWDWIICAQMGALAATYCMENRGPQGHTFTPAEFTARFRNQFDDRGLLDELLSE